MGVLGNIQTIISDKSLIDFDQMDSLKELKIQDVSLDQFQESLKKSTVLDPDFSSLINNYKEGLEKLPIDEIQVTDQLLNQITVEWDGRISGVAEKISEYIADLNDLTFPEISFSKGDGADLFSSLPDGASILSFLETLKKLISGFSKGFIDTGFLSLLELLVGSLKGIGSNALGSSFSIEEVTGSLEDALGMVKKAFSSVSFEPVGRYLAELEKQYNFSHLSQLTDEYASHLSLFNKTINDGKIPTGAFMDDLADRRDRLNEEIGDWKKRLSAGPLEQLSAGLEMIDKFKEGSLKSVLPKMDASVVKFGKVETEKLEAILKTDRIQSGINVINETLDIGLSKVEELRLETIQGAVAQLNKSLKNATETVNAIVRDGGEEVSKMLISPVDQLNEAVSELDLLLNDFELTIKNSVNEFFQPVRDTLSTGVGHVSSALDHLDLQHFRDQLANLLSKIVAALTNQEVLQAIQKLDEFIQSIGRVRVNPVTSKVISALQAITKTLRVIKMVPMSRSLTSEIEKLTKDLPSDLSPITNELLKEVRSLIQEVESFPVLVELTEIAEKIKLEIDQIDPRSYVISHFSEPFESFQQKVETLDIGQLIQPLEEELSVFKTKIKPVLDTSLVRQEMDEAFAEFLEKFDSINTGEIGRRVGDQINESIDAISQRLPVDSLSETLIMASEKYKGGLELVSSKIIEFFDLIKTKLFDLEDHKEDVNGVINGILNEIEDLDSTFPLDEWLENIKPSLSEIINLINEPIQKIHQLITQNTLQEKIAFLQQNIDEVPTHLIDSFGNSPKELKVLDFLKSMNEHVASLQELDKNLAITASSIQGLHLKMETWLDLLADQSMDHLETLSAFLKAKGWGYLRSIHVFFFESVSQLKKIIEELEQGLIGRISTFQDHGLKIEEIASSIKETANILSDLKLIDGSAIDEEIEGVLDNFKNQVRQLNPSQLLKHMDDMIEGLLRDLSLMELLDLSDIQFKYDEVVHKLNEKHPENWVDASIDLQFENLKELSSKYDFSSLVKRLIDVLESLEGQLVQELTKTTVSYAEMQAVLKSEPVKIPVKLPAVKAPKIPKIPASGMKSFDNTQKLKAKF